MVETIENIYKTNIKLIVIGVGILLMLIFGYRYLMNLSKIQPANNRINSVMDSLKLWTTQQQQIIKIQEYRYVQDSIRLSRIELQLTTVPEMIQFINNKYDIQKHNINYFTADQQFSYFSNWLSQNDSL